MINKKIAKESLLDRASHFAISRTQCAIAETDDASVVPVRQQEVNWRVSNCPLRDPTHLFSIKRNNHNVSQTSKRHQAHDECMSSPCSVRLSVTSCGASDFVLGNLRNKAANVFCTHANTQRLAIVPPKK